MDEVVGPLSITTVVQILPLIPASSRIQILVGQTNCPVKKMSSPHKSRKSDKPAILFDLDGTLLDTVYDHVIAWSAALTGAGIIVPQWKIHRRIGMNGESLVHQLLRELKNPPNNIDIEALEKKHDAALQQANPTRTAPRCK